MKDHLSCRLENIFLLVTKSQRRNTCSLFKWKILVSILFQWEIRAEEDVEVKITEFRNTVKKSSCSHFNIKTALIITIHFFWLVCNFSSIFQLENKINSVLRLIGFVPEVVLIWWFYYIKWVILDSLVVQIWRFRFVLFVWNFGTMLKYVPWNVCMYVCVWFRLQVKMTSWCWICI